MFKLRQLYQSLYQFLIQLQDDPLIGLAKIFTTLMVLAGVIQLIEWIMNSSHPHLFGGGLILIFLVMILAYLRRPPAMRLFNITRLGRVVSLNEERTLSIDSNGWGRLTFGQTVLFLDEPKDSDLRDKLHCNERMNFSELEYASPDSKPVNIRREANDLVTVFYSPNKKAEKLKPFTHEFSFRIPENVGDDFYCVRIAINTPKAGSLLSVDSDIPISKVVCFREPRWIGSKKYKKLALYALRLFETEAPPASNFSNKGFQWSIQCPKVGEVYNCMFFFNGGEKRILGSNTWQARLMRMRSWIYQRLFNNKHTKNNIVHERDQDILE